MKDPTGITSSAHVARNMIRQDLAKRGVEDWMIDAAEKILREVHTYMKDYGTLDIVGDVAQDIAKEYRKSLRSGAK